MVNFLAKSLRSGRRSQILKRKVLLGARKKFRRGASETTIWGGGGGGVRCDLIFFLTHISMRARLKVRRSFSCFVSRLKIKKYTEKKIVRVSLLLITLFSMLKTVCLGYRTRKNVWKNQPEKREAQVRDEWWQVKPIFHQSGKCFWKILPTRKSYFLFWLKK